MVPITELRARLTLARPISALASCKRKLATRPAASRCWPGEATSSMSTGTQYRPISAETTSMPPSKALKSPT